jgi:hypothetical protein
MLATPIVMAVSILRRERTERFDVEAQHRARPRQNTEVQCAVTMVPQTKTGPPHATRSLEKVVTPMMRSWNQFSAFIEEWDELRMAAW